MAIEEMEALPATADLHAQPQFLGHPLGLYYIAFTEAFERFSYYGMQVLLVLYMVKQLLLPGHVEHIAGFEGFRALLAHLYGVAPGNQALSSHIFGLYTSLVYLTPIAGGFVADRWLGKTRTVTLGALLMAAGHFMMAFEFSFLTALLLLVIGVGCLKGNLATQVGFLYPPGDNRTADAFQVYYIGINVGVIVSPLVCGYLGEVVGWHWGFGAAGIGMVIGLCIYLAGRRYLPPDPARDSASRAAARRAHKPPMSRRDLQVLILLLLLLPVLAVGAIGNQELYNAYLIWADRSYDLVFFGHLMPTSFLATLDAATAMITLIGAVAFWRWYGTKWHEPDEITKIALGCFVSSLAFVLLAVAASHAAATGTKVSLWVAFAVHMINGIGFANVFPVSLALYSRAAPRAIAATIVGVYYLFLFGANTLVGWVGGWLDVMPAAQFWGLHAALIVGAGAVFVGVKLLFGRLLVPDAAAALDAL
ncbi:MAG: transporter [Sphingomonas bacterium]|uniref:peptide MFS transporter n=1 Tax=Sphingomonas bacterium TaxID=1895847 RepID=UPI00260518EB|nr:peptide MFS transporter [Sphingomonas bacterium]MDB5704572.1 transporter [Sphingomonas bacterium]